MPKVFPMHVISRRTLILDLLLQFNLARSRAQRSLWLTMLIYLVNILSDLQAILWHILFSNMWFIPHPRSATTAQEPILDRMAHSAAKVWVMLNLKVKRTFNQLPSYTAYWIIIPKSARHVSLWQLGVNSRYKRLHVRPQNIKFSCLVCVRAAIVITITLNDLLRPSLPFLKLIVVSTDNI